MVPANVVDRTVQQAGKHRNKEKTKKTHWKNRETKKHIGKQKKTKLLSRPPLQRVWILFV